MHSWRRLLPAPNLAPTAAEIAESLGQLGSCRRCDPRDERAEPRLERLGKRVGCGQSNHSEVVTQPRERAHERSMIGLGGEKNYALVLRLGGACARPRNSFANAVLDTR